MKKAVRLERAIRDALDEHQPLLHMRASPDHWFISGTFDVTGHDHTVIDKFGITIQVSHNFPIVSPIVQEVGGRLPKCADRHVNPLDGTLCYAVWPEWLARNPDQSFATFLSKTLNAYFLGQLYFEQGEPWPQGERHHDAAGQWQAAQSLIGADLSNTQLLAHLKSLRGPWPKGHWTCPCGSGRSIRQCCHVRLKALSEHILPLAARAMHDELCKKEDKIGFRRRSQWRQLTKHRVSPISEIDNRCIRT